MHTTIKAAVAKFESHDLRRIRDVLSAELHVAIASGRRGNTVDVGKLEMLQAIGEVLDERREAMTPPTFVDVSYIDGHKLSRAVRVY